MITGKVKVVFSLFKLMVVLILILSMICINSSSYGGVWIVS